MTSFKTEFVIYETFSASLSVYIANEEQMSAIEQNSITLQSDINDVVINVTIHEVFHVSKLTIELFSVNRIIEKRAQIVCINDECRIYAKNEKQILHVVKHRDQYELQLVKFKVMMIAMTSQHTHKYNEKTLKI